MAEQAYLRTCPADGAPLVPNTDRPEIPPWRCDECHHSYWVAELTTYARLAYRRPQRDFGHLGSKTHKTIRAEVLAELEAACHRGLSVRREQLGLLRPRTMENLLLRGHPIHPEFEALMRAQLP